MQPEPQSPGSAPTRAELAAHLRWLDSQIEQIEAERPPAERHPATMANAIRAFKHAIGPALVIGLIAGIAISSGNSSASTIEKAGVVLSTTTVIAFVISMAWATRARLRDERAADRAEREIRTFERDRDRKLLQATSALTHTRAQLDEHLEPGADAGA